MVCSLIDNGTRHHNSQSVVDSREAAEWVHNNFDHCDDAYRCR